jgi:hypothetical protein
MYLILPQSNWGACQRTARACNLDYNDPSDASYFSPPAECYQGSVPNYYINVANVSNIQAALAFAEKTGVPLVTKNSGHDYKGRSSGPGSLAIWTKNVNPEPVLVEKFVPEGCSEAVGNGVTFGAGAR